MFVLFSLFSCASFLVATGISHGLWSHITWVAPLNQHQQDVSKWLHVSICPQMLRQKTDSCHVGYNHLPGQSWTGRTESVVVTLVQLVVAAPCKLTTCSYSPCNFKKDAWDPHTKRVLIAGQGMNVILRVSQHSKL